LPSKSCKPFDGPALNIALAFAKPVPNFAGLSTGRFFLVGIFFLNPAPIKTFPAGASGTGVGTFQEPGLRRAFPPDGAQILSVLSLYPDWLFRMD